MLARDEACECAIRPEGVWQTSYSCCDAWLEFVLQVLPYGYCVVTLRYVARSEVFSAFCMKQVQPPPQNLRLTLAGFGRNVWNTPLRPPNPVRGLVPVLALRRLSPGIGRRLRLERERLRNKGIVLEHLMREERVVRRVFGRFIYSNQVAVHIKVQIGGRSRRRQLRANFLIIRLPHLGLGTY